ncbi:MAG TPA: M55 family metallopeptidase [Terriglobia bacterium]|nr:M55 family metallopeptidase [Terriglobia bacterium]
MRVKVKSNMMKGRLEVFVQVLGAVVLLACVTSARAQAGKPKKVFMITDMEGVDGIFSSEQQCIPYKSPRWEESHKLLTGEVNAAVDGLLDGGATEVVVWDGHDSSQSLSALDINPRARLLTGEPVSPTLELDSTYAAVIFIGQHAMAGAEKAVLSHSYSSEGIQNIWVNGKPVGEIGGRVMLAGDFGVPVIMLSGDTAACKELHDLVPEAECAEVKTGVSRTAGFTLSHPAACALIREKAQRAMQRLAEFKPYKMTGPVEVKVEFTTRSEHSFLPREGVERVDDRTWAFHGKDIIDAWLKYSDF